MNMRLQRRWFRYLILLLVLAVACFAIGNLVTERSPAEAQAPAADEPVPQQGARACKIVYLAVYFDRIHVECQPSSIGGPTAIDTIIYFEAPLASAADSRQANRYLSLLMTAYTLGKIPILQWDTTFAPNLPSCAPENCRRLTGVVLQ